jgi:hypothetical protein
MGALRQVSLREFGSSQPIIIPPMLHTYVIGNWHSRSQHQGTQSHLASVIIEHEYKGIKNDIDKRENKGDEINIKVRGNLLAHLK